MSVELIVCCLLTIQFMQFFLCMAFGIQILWGGGGGGQTILMQGICQGNSGGLASDGAIC